jgi:concanavalin A-like lectin/glucanase superfamily protein
MENDPQSSSKEIDIAALSFQYLDRSLGHAQRKTLNDQLRRDSQARLTFVRCLLQGVELEEILATEKETESLQALAEAATGQADHSTNAKDLIADESPEIDHEKTWSRTRPSPSTTASVGQRFVDRIFVIDQGRVSVPRILATVAAAIVFGAGLGMWTLRSTRDSHSSVDLVAKDALSTPDADSPRISKAVLVKVTNCRWDRTRSTANLAGGGLKPGQSLHLLEGLAEIQSTFPNGSEGTIQLEGPSAMTLSEDGMPNLIFGKLSGQFSCREDSFRVGTTFGQIAITGDSSLGVMASDDKVEVHVFSGGITLEMQSVIATSKPIQLVKVEAGTSVRMRADAAGKISVDRGIASENQFVTPTSLAASRLLIPDQYVSAIRESQPIAYWRFEEERDGFVRNEVADRFRLRMGGNAVRLRSSQGQRCAEFGIAAGPGYMMTDDVFDDVIKDDYTVELWVKPTCFHHGSLFSLINWSTDVNPKGRHRVYLEVCGPRYWDYQTPGGEWESDPGRLLFINCKSEFYSSKPYVVRKWQHLVALRERSNMKLYADGHLVVSKSSSEKLGSGMRVLIGQLYPPSRFIRDDITARLYSGELDEVSLYDRALSEAEIRKHLELAKSNVDKEPRDSI